MKNNNGKRGCSECHSAVEEQRLFMVDGKYVCNRCLYGDADPFEIYPIGIVNNGLRRSESDFGTKGDVGISVIELMPSQKRFMYGLEDERNITIVYYLHRSRPVRSVFKRGLDGKTKGVFATRTPDRLSRIGIQDVRLDKVEGLNLYVEGLDAVDGTPVIDIKLCWSNLRK